MKKATKFLFATLMLSLGLSGFAWADNGDDPINVTFMVNTATVGDTLTAENGLVQLRGAINGEEGDVNWSAQSVALDNIGGDYWQITLELNPGDAMMYKFWAGFAADTSAASGGDWEGGDDRSFSVPEDQTEDMMVETFFNRIELFEAKEDTVAIYFRVNLAGYIQDGEFDHEEDGGTVGLRGADPYLDWGATHILEREGDTDFYSGLLFANVDTIAQRGPNFEYKFVFGAGDAVTWEDGDNKQGMFAATDTTVHWTYFNDNAPTEADRVATEIRFAVNVDILEGLGIFSSAAGDRMQVPGGFNGWGTGGGDVASTMEPAPVAGQNVWALTYDRTQNPIVVGADLQYKYFVNWSEDRFDSDSDAYIPFLAAGDGWEEPGSTGGGNRVHIVTDNANQTAYNADIGFVNYNGIDAAGLILSNLVEGDAGTVAVTFRVDMTNALSVGAEIADADDLFVPGQDSLYLLIEENILAFTQGIARGPGAFENLNPADPDDRAFVESLKFSPVAGEDNIYELTLDLELPSVNSFGFILGWGQVFTGEGALKTWNGGGFDAGRRHYQFVTPTAVREVAGSLISEWPAAYTLNTIEFTGGERLGGSPLVFETPPDYEEIAASIGDDGFSTRPAEISLKQNYPNPFNPTTNIAFTLAETSDVTLTVYNVLGQRVATVVNTQLNAGTHTFTFDGSRLASGMYIYRLQTGNAMLQRQMMLIK